MILSKLTLDISNPSVRQALKNCQDMHRNLMGAFDSSRKQADLLYRLVHHKNSIDLYVLSAVMPQWNNISRNGYICVQTRNIEALKETYSNGSILHFDLLACPAKKVHGNGKNSQRVFLRTAEERTEWLERQAAGKGFELLSTNESGIPISIIGKKGVDQIHYAAVNFTGYLKITDAPSFWNNYFSGYGPGKSYGLGMMLISK